MVEVVFLGTSSMVPTKERNHSSVLIRYKNHGILIDAGEGTQRQMKIANIPLTRITKILISHWHGDHVFGLPGIISSLGASEYQKILEIYGPKGTKKYCEAMFKAFVFDKRIDMKITEIKQGKFFENDEFTLEAMELDHGIPTLGYNFIEKNKRRIDVKKVKKLGIPEGPLLGKLQDGKNIEIKGEKIRVEETTYIVEGKKISLIADTALCKNCHALAKDADLLICEATFTSKFEEKGEEYGHMTAKQAASIANKANVKQLFLNHLSARYKTPDEIINEAKTYFHNSRVAEDFMKIKI